MPSLGFLNIMFKFGGCMSLFILPFNYVKIWKAQEVKRAEWKKLDEWGILISNGSLDYCSC